MAIVLDESGRTAPRRLLGKEDARRYPVFEMAEIALAILLVGVLFIADPDRLQTALDQIRELAAWLAE